MLGKYNYKASHTYIYDARSGREKERGRESSVGVSIRFCISKLQRFFEGKGIPTVQALLAPSFPSSVSLPQTPRFHPLAKPPTPLEAVEWRETQWRRSQSSRIISKTKNFGFVSGLRSQITSSFFIQSLTIFDPNISERIYKKLRYDP